MRELVGHCKSCGIEVYCNDGFFTGVILEDKSILCFDCEKAAAEPSDSRPGDAGPSDDSKK